MSNFIPANIEKANELEARLSKEIFRSAKEFVEFYNSGLINKKFDKVKDIAKEITEVFKNVKEKSGNLVFISEAEVTLEEIIQKLSPWEAIVKAKRETQDAINAKIINSETTVILTESGTLSYINEDNEISTLNGEKIHIKTDNIEQLLSYSSYGNEYQAEYEGYPFQANDLANIDTDFILRVKELLPTA